MTFNFRIFSRPKAAWQYKSEPESIHVLGVFFWRALLLFAFVVLLFALWFGVQELDAASQAETVSATSANPPPPLTSMQLQSALDFYSAQQSQYQSLSQSPLPQVADPSK